MAIQELNNVAEITGILDGRETGGTDAVVVYLVDGLTMTKTADKLSWAGGELTYTVVLTNNTGFDYTDVVFTDTLDPAHVVLDTQSVAIGTETLVENTDFTYNPTTGDLEIRRTPMIEIADTTSITITFRVTKA